MRVRYLLLGEGILSDGLMVNVDISLPWEEVVGHLIRALRTSERFRIEVQGQVASVIFSEREARAYQEIEFSSDDLDEMFRLVRLMSIFTINMLITPSDAGDMEKVFRIMSTNMGRKMGVIPSQLARTRYQSAEWDELRPIIVGLLNGELGFPD